MKTFIGCIFLSMLSISPCLAKNLYVSTAGNDDVTYADNSVSTPWRTLGHAIYNLKAGDTLLVRKGIYTPAFPLILRSDYASKSYGGDPSEDMNAESGTASEPVTVKAEDGHSVVIDLRNVSTFMQLDNKSYWRFQGLHFVNATIVFAVGENAKTEHNTFEDLDIRVINGGDNFAAIQLINGNAEHTIIRRNRLVGPENYSSLHLNTAGIYLKTIKSAVIENNEIRNFPIGIYYKHRTGYSSPADVVISIKNNLIENTNRSAMDLNCDYAEIHNNIIGENNQPISLNNANGSPGGDYNSIKFNTFYSGGLVLNHNTQDGDSQPGAIGNEIYGNVFYGMPLKIHEYSSLDHQTELDYNVYGGSAAVIENRVSYTLDSWRAHAGQDASSVSGSLAFKSGLSDRDLGRYSLKDSSAGAGLVYDGSQVGSMTAEVGSKGLSPDSK